MKKARILLGALIFFGLCLPLPGQVLEAVADAPLLLAPPSSDPPSDPPTDPPSPGALLVEEPELPLKRDARPPHRGLTIEGSRGMLTIPCPGPKQDSGEVVIGLSGGRGAIAGKVGGTAYRFHKTESQACVNATFGSGVECYARQLFMRRRIQAQGSEAVSRTHEALSGGAQISIPMGNARLGLGGTATTLTDMADAQIDFRQAEALRSLYLTVSTPIGTKATAVAGVRRCPGLDQRMTLEDGRSARVAVSPFQIAMAGLDFRVLPNLSLILEGKSFPHQDLFRNGKETEMVDAGLRFQCSGWEAEAFCLTANDHPEWHFGTALRF